MHKISISYVRGVDLNFTKSIIAKRNEHKLKNETYTIFDPSFFHFATPETADQRSHLTPV